MREMSAFRKFMSFMEGQMHMWQQIPSAGEKSPAGPQSLWIVSDRRQELSQPALSLRRNHRTCSLSFWGLSLTYSMAGHYLEASFGFRTVLVIFSSSERKAHLFWQDIKLLVTTPGVFLCFMHFSYIPGCFEDKLFFMASQIHSSLYG